MNEEKLEVFNRPVEIQGYLEVESERLSGLCIESGITAGTTQTLVGATQLTAKYSVLGTVANSSDAVKLPDLAPGQELFIKNSGASVAAVWPASVTRQINGGTLAAVDGTTLGVGSTRVYIGDVDGINYVSFELNIQAHAN
jgi:hypothetical protein